MRDTRTAQLGKRASAVRQLGEALSSLSCDLTPGEGANETENDLLLRTGRVCVSCAEVIESVVVLAAYRHPRNPPLRHVHAAGAGRDLDAWAGFLGRSRCRGLVGLLGRHGLSLPGLSGLLADTPDSVSCYRDVHRYIRTAIEAASHTVGGPYGAEGCAGVLNETVELYESVSVVTGAPRPAARRVPPGWLLEPPDGSLSAVLDAEPRPCGDLCDEPLKPGQRCPRHG